MGVVEEREKAFWSKWLLACFHYTLLFTQCLPISKHSYGRLLHYHHTLDWELFVEDLRMMCTRICTRVPPVILRSRTYCYKLHNFSISVGSDGTCFWLWVRRQAANSYYVAAFFFSLFLLCRCQFITKIYSKCP